MTAYFQTVTITQPTAVFAIPAPGDTVSFSDLGLDPDAAAAPVQPPVVVSDTMDPRWRLVDSEIQPASVGLSVAQGQIAFRLTHASTDASTVTATTGGTPTDDTLASGPYRLRDATVSWQNAAVPATWGEPGSVVARASLQGDLGDDLTYAIDVVLTDGEIHVSHTDADLTTLDYSSPLSAAPAVRRPRSDGDVQTFQWLRIQSDAAGTDFWVYASVDGLVWELLVHETMSADMQAAFVRSTLEFSMTASGTSAAGAWVVGSINVAARAASYPGLYTHDQDQAGFAYNAGVWNQFGPPLDGYRSEYTFDSINQRYEDASGGVHYGFVTAVTYAKDDPNVVYATVDQHAVLFISHDGGLHWSLRPIAFAAADPQPSGADPDAPLSADPGSDWFDLASPHSGEVLALYWNQFASSNPGVWHSTDESTTWTRIAELPSDPLETTNVLLAGGMQASSGKVWWAAQVGEDSVTPPPDSDAPTPRWRTLWSGSLAWSIAQGEPPEDQPVLTIPPLDVSQITDAAGVTTSAARAYLVCSTPGIWQPSIVAGKTFVLYEDGMQDVWHSPEGLEGIYGNVGYTSHVQPQFLWQPGSVSDADVATYWDMLANAADYRRRVRAWQTAHPGEPLPPELTLPNMGGYQGRWIEAIVLGKTSDLLETVNSRAGVMISQSWDFKADKLGYGPGIDYSGSIVPSHPESSGQVAHAVIHNVGPEGGKVHLTISGDYLAPFDTRLVSDGVNSEKKSMLDMNGVLSVVVVDIEPDDAELYTVMGGGGIPCSGAYRLIGGQFWDVVSGGPGSYVTASRLIGPPGHAREVTYDKFIPPTYVYEEQDNYPELPVSVTVSPAYAPAGSGGTEAVGGVLVAAQVAFGATLPAIPDGWTELEDTDQSSASGLGSGGNIGSHTGTLTTPSFGVYLGLGETGQWLRNASDEPVQFREYLQANVEYSMASIRQRLITCPVPTGGSVTLDLDASTDPYWFVAASFGTVFRVPAGTGPPPTVTATTWAINQANFDGSAAQTVGELVFETTGLRGPDYFQVRPFSDDLCLVTSHYSSEVWRVQPGSGAVPVWTADLQAASWPWDAVGLDSNTFVAVSAVPSPAPESSPDAASTVYVYRTTDAGATWQRVSTIANLEGFALRTLPDESQILDAPDPDNVVMLGTASNIDQQTVWMSNDGGLSWSKNANWAEPYFDGEWSIGRPWGLVAFPGSRPVIIEAVRTPQASIVG